MDSSAAAAAAAAATPSVAEVLGGLIIGVGLGLV